ncbi:MAG: LysM peptidoglycan-binding domain-containing protein [Betaproteobacteria bacterium]|nr:MAG: LysM peptidoglycan-binding domain-containing protein [Betaproteobacteria bacterium]
MALTLAGCSSRPVQAPVIERAPPAVTRPAAPAADTRSETYTVKHGDTLFSIALDQGHDYKELAAWNKLDKPNLIHPGQQLRLKPPPGVQEAPVTVSPITSSGRVETRPLGAQGPVRADPAAHPPSAQEPVKSEPLARKLPYSPENVALLQRGETRPGAGPVPAPAPASAPALAGKTDADIDEEDKVEWGWPVRGRILAGFSEASNKGLDIAGTLGDPVIAAAPGRVVYSGSGLRGYGKLVIIKHNKTYLSAYAHNKDILVKEGQSVVKGQKIAEIGSTDTDAPKLHFEIRKLGKPVDPARFLPPS